MKVKILFVFSNEIEEIIIKSDIWSKLHKNKESLYRSESYYYIHKEHKDWLKKNNLEPTIFNLNCLMELKGVILTEAKVLDRIEKGGLKE